MFTPKDIELTCMHNPKHKLKTDIIGTTIIHFDIKGSTKTIALRKSDVEKLAAHIIELLDYME